MDVSTLEWLLAEDKLAARESLACYLQTARMRREQLGATRHVGDATQAGAVAHKPMSSQRALGALPLGDRSDPMEDAVTSAGAVAARVMMPSFEAELRRFRAEIRADLDRRVS